MIFAKESPLITIQNKDYKYGVVDTHAKEIVPFGKYSWIDGFDKGLARVNIQVDVENEKIGTRKYWGIIDEKGNEVLPLKFDEIWNFYDKGRYSTKLIKNGVSKDIDLSSLNSLSSKSLHRTNKIITSETEHFIEFSATYAQDVMEYSDETINDAFEGDPDAYWNID